MIAHFGLWIANMRFNFFLCCFLCCCQIFYLSLSFAQERSITITDRDERQLQTGITHVTLRTAEPASDVQVLMIDLCTEDLHLVATEQPTRLKTTAEWGRANDAQIVINADFFKTGPLRVYGDAIGAMGPWPLINTGRHSDYANSWYFGRYGFLTAQPGGIDFSHTGHVKREFASGLLSLTSLNGISPDRANPESPFDSYALVSGFPELVTEGILYECADMQASSCFPDRSDMRERNPRSAMGISQDRRTLILMTVDGRSSRSQGVYGAELAWLMAEMGAWQAFNLDGGGSSQLWHAEEGYLNAAASNAGGNVRAVANHLGVVFKSNEGAPHCPNSDFFAPLTCPALAQEGGEISEESGCTKLFGETQYWRELSSGQGGHSYWTNAWNHWAPGNWVEWSINTVSAGLYELEVYMEGEPRNPNVRYQLRHAGRLSEMRIDQGQFSEGRWVSLGTYEFALGGGQWLRMFDNYDGDQPEPRKQYLDSIRLRRLDLPVTGGNESEAGEPIDISGTMSEELAGVESGTEQAYDMEIVMEIAGQVGETDFDQDLSVNTQEPTFDMNMSDFPASTEQEENQMYQGNPSCQMQSDQSNTKSWILFVFTFILLRLKQGSFH